MPKNSLHNSKLWRKLCRNPKRGYEPCRSKGSLKRGYCHGQSPHHLETKSKPLQVPQELPLNLAIAKWLSDITLNLQQSLVNNQQPKRIFNHVTLGNPHHMT